MVMTKHPSPPRAWQRMLSGRRLDLLNPSPLDIEIEDIAHGLSRVARWNGQTKGAAPFSVAQHSLLVVELFCALNPKASATAKLTTLLHDAAEYVIGDLISPFKAMVGPQYQALEQRLIEAIHLRFSLPARPPRDLAALIKKADSAAAYLEAITLAGFDEASAQRFFQKPGITPRQSLEALPADRVKAEFLTLFHQLDHPA